MVARRVSDTLTKYRDNIESSLNEPSHQLTLEFLQNKLASLRAKLSSDENDLVWYTLLCKLKQVEKGTTL